MKLYHKVLLPLLFISLLSPGYAKQIIDEEVDVEERVTTIPSEEFVPMVRNMSCVLQENVIENMINAGFGVIVYDSSLFAGTQLIISSKVDVETNSNIVFYFQSFEIGDSGDILMCIIDSVVIKID